MTSNINIKRYQVPCNVLRVSFTLSEVLLGTASMLEAISVGIYLGNSGNFCQVAPITDEFRRDFEGANVGDWHHDRAAFVRRGERCRARGRERPLLQLVSSDNRRSRGWLQHHAGVAVSPPI